LGYSRSFHAPYKTPADQIPALKKKWEEERHQAWRKREGVWIARALVGPLFHLGLADLAHAEHLTLIEVAESELLDELCADRRLGPLIVARLSDRIAAAAPGKAQDLVRALLKVGHTPKLVER